MIAGIAAIVLAGLGQNAADARLPVIHEQRLDDVGLASVMAMPDDAGAGSRVTIAHRTLPADSFAEVTDLTSGRTIIAVVQGNAPLVEGVVGSLSPAAARALGLSMATRSPIRIRPALPSPAEQAAVRGGTVVSRLDAPAALLVALRRRLPQPLPVVSAEPASTSVASAPVKAAVPVRTPRRPTPAPTPVKRPPAAVTGRWLVQVATLSDSARAAALAKSVDGVVRSAGRLYRVQAGPFATRAAAETARASIARRGFDDARIIAQD